MHQPQHFHAAVHHPVATDRAPPIRHGAQAGGEVTARGAAFGALGCAGRAFGWAGARLALGWRQRGSPRRNAIPARALSAYRGGPSLGLRRRTPIIGGNLVGETPCEH